MSKDNNIYYAEAVLQKNSINEEKGEVTFYFARFDSPDKRNRKMDSKAFNRSFKNNIDQIYHLNNHNEEAPIGRILAFGTDDKGAWVTSKLSNSTAGRDALIRYSEGIYKHHSFGFYITNSHTDGDVEIVTEAKVVEVSTVLHPAHNGATTISLNGDNNILRRLESIEALLSAEKHQNSHESTDIADALKYIQEY